MKKISFILILLPLAAYGILALTSSGQEYAAERLFYRAMEINRKITINPDVTPPAMFTSVENKLKEILEKYPETEIAKEVHLSLAKFYLENKKYDQTLSVLEKISSTYSQDRPILSEAHFLRGTTYERQNLWSEALQEYKILRDKYTDTALGIQIPIYIGNYYKEKGRYAQANRSYNQAVLFYEKLRSENKRNDRSYLVANLLLQAHMNLKNYKQAGKVVEDIINIYPSLVTFRQQLPKVELIFVNLLEKPEKAIEIYNNVKAKTNNDKLIKILEKKIKTLEK